MRRGEREDWARRSMRMGEKRKTGGLAENIWEGCAGSYTRHPRKKEEKEDWEIDASICSIHLYVYTSKAILHHCCMRLSYDEG
jgi:hypothetical protein